GAGGRTPEECPGPGFTLGLRLDGADGPVTAGAQPAGAAARLGHPARACSASAAEGDRGGSTIRGAHQSAREVLRPLNPSKTFGFRALIALPAASAAIWSKIAENWISYSSRVTYPMCGMHTTLSSVS